LGSTLKPINVSKEFQNAFIDKIVSPGETLSRACRSLGGLNKSKQQAISG
jgi:hypothetical protein